MLSEQHNSILTKHNQNGSYKCNITHVVYRHKYELTYIRVILAVDYHGVDSECYPLSSHCPGLRCAITSEI